MTAFILFNSIQAIDAQQKLNLDFENLSAEGTARPWGWNINSYAPGVAFICDTKEVISGKYSLKISNTNEEKSERFELSFFIEPSQILNSKISIGGFAKSENFDGTAGINLKSVGAVGEEYATLNESETEINEYNSWQNYYTDINIESEPHSILVTLYFQGSGTVWFDNLTLKVNDKAVYEISVAPTFNKAQLKTITKNTSVLKTVEPSIGATLQKNDFRDLDYIKEIIGDSKIIALGESTHGTSEFFKVKHRLLQYAILELGVRVFILEDNQLIVERINNFVLYGKGEALTVIKGLFGVWNREEMLQLIKWVRSYNIENPKDRVEFVGMDVQDPKLALEHLNDFLSQKDTLIQKKSNQLLAELKKEWRNSYFKEDSTLLKWDNDAKANYNLFVANKNKWLVDAQNKSDSINVEWVIKNARTIKQFVEATIGGNYEGRDKAMSENVQWIITQRSPETKVVIWAHDSHISRGDAQDRDSNFFSGQSMGSYLSKEYQSDYKALGLFTYQGTCLGTISYSNFDLITFEIYTSPDGSLDEALHQISKKRNENNLIMNLKPFKNQLSEYKWMTKKRPVRYVGYVAEDYGFGGRYSIPYQFDGIIFIDQSTAATKIKSN